MTNINTKAYSKTHSARELELVKGTKWDNMQYL